MFVCYITLFACFLGGLASAQDNTDNAPGDDIVQNLIPLLKSKTSEALNTLNDILQDKKPDVAKRTLTDQDKAFIESVVRPVVDTRDVDGNAQIQAFEDELEKAEAAVAVLNQAIQFARDAFETALESQ